MRRVVFLSKSKLSQNLLQSLLDALRVDCICISSPDELKLGIVNVQNCLLILDDTEFTDQSQNTLDAALRSLGDKIPKIAILQNQHTHPVPAHWPVVATHQKPILADTLETLLQNDFGASS